MVIDNVIFDSNQITLIPLHVFSLTEMLPDAKKIPLMIQ